MANRYVKSGATGAADGSGWDDAYTTIAAALAASSAGDGLYVSHQHAESTAGAVTLTSPGTAASPVTILCVNDGAEPPTTLATTATVTTTGTASIFFAGFAYCYGVTFNAGTGSTNSSIFFAEAAPWWWRVENGGLNLVGTNAAARISTGNASTGADDQLLELVNTTLGFGSTSQGVNNRCPVLWRGGSLTGTMPATLFQGAGSGAGVVGWVDIEGVDLSATSGNLIEGGQGVYTHYRLQNCKLHASATVVTGTNAGQGAITIDMVNCDGGDTNYRYRKFRYQGNITHEATIVRTGGATNGTTPISRKMVTSANSKFYSPLESDPILLWNESTAEQTLTVEVVTDNVTLTDAEAWLEIEYPGTSGFPLSVFARDRAASALATPANQTSSSVEWTTTGLTTPVKQKLAVTFTAAGKGLIRARVMLAKPSTTMYFCPKISA